MAQKHLVLEHLRRHGHISTRDARDDLGVERLAARILELRDMGYEINTEHKRNARTGKPYARYHLKHFQPTVAAA